MDSRALNVGDQYMSSLESDQAKNILFLTFKVDYKIVHKLEEPFIDGK